MENQILFNCFCNLFLKQVNSSYYIFINMITTIISIFISVVIINLLFKIFYCLRLQYTIPKHSWSYAYLVFNKTILYFI